LYLDIFGWIRGRQQLLEQQCAEPRGPSVTGLSASDAVIQADGTDVSPSQEHVVLLRLQEELQQDLERWRAELEQHKLTANEEARVHDLMARSKTLLASVAARLGVFETQAVRKAPAHIMFAPATFSPQTAATKPSHHTVRHFEPGRFPGRAFCGATTMVLLLWVAGSIFCRILARGPIEEYPAVEVGTDDGPERETFMDSTEGAVKYETLPAFFPQTHNKELEVLPPPTSIEVEWPEHEGFFPRALSSDVSGTQLVVADDFGLYHAKLERFEHEETKLEPRNFLDTAEKRAPAERLVAKFRPLQPCSGIQGQGFEDMTVNCLSSSSCHVFVLLKDGKQFIECPLDVFKGNAASSDINEMENKTAAEDITWTISQQWLATGNPKEQVDAIAVNSQCLHSSKSSANDAHNLTSDAIGCVLVSTTGGRILQMRSHVSEHRVLVPARTVYRQRRPVVHGGLNSLENGMLVALSQTLSKRSATVLVLNPQDGSVHGTWKLPMDATWLTFSGGGDNMFALGIRAASDEPELFLFPNPQQSASRTSQKSRMVRS